MFMFTCVFKYVHVLTIPFIKHRGAPLRSQRKAVSALCPTQPCSEAASLVCAVVLACPEPVNLFMENRDVTAPGDSRWCFVCEKDGAQALHTFNLVSFSCEASVIHNTVTLFGNVSLNRFYL